ncbi:MAG: hypothetical protein MHMPM18_002670 [Marteilia pararefringens]
MCIEKGWQLLGPVPSWNIRSLFKKFPNNSTIMHVMFLITLLINFHDHVKALIKFDKRLPHIQRIPYWSTQIIVSELWTVFSASFFISHRKSCKRYKASLYIVYFSVANAILYSIRQNISRYDISAAGNNLCLK